MFATSRRHAATSGATGGRCASMWHALQNVVRFSGRLSPGSPLTWWASSGAWRPHRWHVHPSRRSTTRRRRRQALAGSRHRHQDAPCPAPALADLRRDLFIRPAAGYPSGKTVHPPAANAVQPASRPAAAPVFARYSRPGARQRVRGAGVVLGYHPARRRRPAPARGTVRDEKRAAYLRRRLPRGRNAGWVPGAALTMPFAGVRVPSPPPHRVSDFA